jgi:hypothetical protein
VKILLHPALALALAFAITACAHTAGRGVTDPSAPRALAAEGPVTVEWDDPARFTEIRTSFNRHEASRGNWVQELAEHLREGIQARIGEGERVHVRITDIDRAGDFEPGRGPDLDHVRIMRDIHWPRMSLEFEHHDAAGNLVNSGARELSDPGYLSSQLPLPRTDPLRYEKTMIDRWLHREFGPVR